MKRFVAVGLILWSIAAAGQEGAALRAAMYLTGASSAEEVDPWEVERLEGLGKILVNSPGRKGRTIFSEYQLASLEDYRSRHGDILSFEELALVDGFGKECVDALKPFLSLYSDRLPGARDTVRTRADILLRATEKNIGAKAKATGRNWQVAGAVRGEDWTAHAEASYRRLTVTAGDFNLRYGQGIGLWSGFSMTSLSTVDAFIKRPAGISPMWSFTPSANRGAAVEYSGGHLAAQAFATLNGTAGAHAQYLSRSGEAGITLARSSTGAVFSADGRYNLRGTLLALEAAFRNSSAGCQAAVKTKAGDVRLAFQGRVLPSAFSGKKYGEYALAAGGEWKSPAHRLSLTADAALLPIPQEDPSRRQLRIYGIWAWQISPQWILDSRYTGRLRSYEASRNDLRLDLKFSSAQWLSTLRAEAVYCGGPGFLSYLEGGWKGETAAAYLRLTGYRTHAWASRIYCYERDAPGSFSVPAYSGKGLATSLYAAWKKRFKKASVKLYFRGGLAFPNLESLTYVYHVTLEVVPSF